MNRVREGELTVARPRSPQSKIIVGKAILVDSSQDLVSIRTNRNGEIQNVRMAEAYGLNTLIDYYEKGNKQPDRKRQRKGETDKTVEKMALALCLEAEPYHPELSVFLKAMSPETVQKAKAFLQTIMEKEVWIDYRALRYKAKKMPERHK